MVLRFRYRCGHETHAPPVVHRVGRSTAVLQACAQRSGRLQIRTHQTVDPRALPWEVGRRHRSECIVSVRFKPSRFSDVGPAEEAHPARLIRTPREPILEPASVGQLTLLGQTRT